MTQPHVHILLLGLSDQPVGGYRVAYAYANWLASHGVPVTVWHSRAFFSETAKGLRRQRKILNSRVRHVVDTIRRRPVTVTWFDLDPAVTVRVSGGLPRISVNPGDILVGTAVESMPAASRFSRKHGAKSIGFIQHYEDWAATDDFIRAAWASVDTRVVIAPWLAERAATLGLDSTLVLNAVDVRDFAEGPRLQAREPSVLTLLSPHPYKRSDIAIEVLKRLHAEDPGLQLRAFGQFSRPNGLPSFVHYVQNPSATALASLYATSTIYLCSSDAEGWHLPPAEATLSGAAVVSTRIGGVEVSMMDDALYAPPGDVAGLTKQVLSALRDVATSQQRVDRAGTRLRDRTPDVSSSEFARAIGLETLPDVTEAKEGE